MKAPVCRGWHTTSCEDGNPASGPLRPALPPLPLCPAVHLFALLCPYYVISWKTYVSASLRQGGSGNPDLQLVSVCGGGRPVGSVLTPGRVCQNPAELWDPTRVMGLVGGGGGKWSVFLRQPTGCVFQICAVFLSFLLVVQNVMHLH